MPFRHPDSATFYAIDNMDPTIFVDVVRLAEIYTIVSKRNRRGGLG